MTSPACCALAAVVTTEYTPKGTYQTIGDLNVYTIGPSDSKRAIIFAYDIFGIRPQTLQGCDRLSAHLNALVLLPDFFKGDVLGLDVLPPDTEEKQARLAEFTTGKLDFAVNAQNLKAFALSAKSTYPSVESWGAFGLCWGGKVSVLGSAADTVFKVSGQAHPGKLATEDAQALTVPHIVLASDGEPADIVAEYKEVLQGQGYEGVVETYTGMHHGWMGARANLEDVKNAKEFERGYKQVANFFAKYL